MLVKTTPMSLTLNPNPIMHYAGIDYHKRYSVVHVLDESGETVGKGRINHDRPANFRDFFDSIGGSFSVVFEASMNWHWLHDILEEIDSIESIVMAHPYKTRIIAEAQVKSDKIDARLLAQLLRGDLICKAYACGREARHRKELVRQRAFWVRIRTSLRNRVHRLLGGEHDLQLPEVSDLFGRKGIGVLNKLELHEPARMQLKQNLRMLSELNQHIKTVEKSLDDEIGSDENVIRLKSIPGIGPIIAAVIVSEIDHIERFNSSNKFCSYAGLIPSSSSSGGKTHNGKLVARCNRWLRWAFVEAAWVAVGCDGYFGSLYRQHKARGKKPNTAIMIVARRMCQITYRLLTEKREYSAAPLNDKTFPGGSEVRMAV